MLFLNLVTKYKAWIELKHRTYKDVHCLLK